MVSFVPLRDSNTKPATCLVVTAGIGMVDTLDRIATELEISSAVHVMATPLAARWMDDGGMRANIEKLTGAPVESEFRSPWDDKKALMYNRCVVAPLTLNTLTKWSQGQPDNLAVSMLCEATWTDGITVTAHLTLNGAYGAHPAAKPAIKILEDAGVETTPYVAGPTMKQVLSATYGINQVPINLQTSSNEP